VYRFRPGPPSHLPRIRFPHPRYRIIFIEGPKSRGRNLKGFAPNPWRMLCTRHPHNGWPNWETNEARGKGSCRGRSKRIGPLSSHRFWSGGIGRCTTYTPQGHRSSHSSAFLTVGSIIFYRGGRNLKGSALNPSHIGSALVPHRVAGPQRKSNEVRGGGSCTGSIALSDVWRLGGGTKNGANGLGHVPAQHRQRHRQCQGACRASVRGTHGLPAQGLFATYLSPMPLARADESYSPAS
jgi:hypothetical protein